MSTSPSSSDAGASSAPDSASPDSASSDSASTDSASPGASSGSGASREHHEPPIWSWRGQHPAPSAIGGESDTLHSSALQAAETPRMARLVMTGSLAVFIVLAVVLTFAPWRQTVSGSGSVTSFSPGARPQTIESQISGRIQEWAVVEGDDVSKGDTIVVLEDISSSYLSEQFVEQIASSRRSELRVLRLETETARQRLLQSEQTLRAARAKLRNASNEVSTARRRVDRVAILREDGLASLREYEDEQLALQNAEADSVTAAADVEGAQQSVQSARLAVEQAENRLEARRADLNLKLDNARQRQEASIVRAPSDGTVARINRAGPGQTVKEGGKLAVIVPNTGDQAAEIFVSGMDAAIVDPGRRVQLQFAGFPALQFSGFPGASVGTFSGTVRVVDAVDDGTGRYRLLVVPDTTADAPAWPSSQYLRQGSSVTGWVLLSNVPLGRELWRRINGLPPQIPVRDNKFKRKPK